MTVLGRALGKPAGRVEVEEGVVGGKVGSLVVEGRLGKPRTRDPAGQHLGLLNGSLVLGVALQSSGPVGGYGRLGSVA
jgi:hypothetical protein